MSDKTIRMALERAFFALGRAGGNTADGPYRKEWLQAREALAETEQSVAADAYWHIADVLGTQSGWSVQEHVEQMRELLVDVQSLLRLWNDKNRFTQMGKRIDTCLAGLPYDDAETD